MPTLPLPGSISSAGVGWLWCFPPDFNPLSNVQVRFSDDVFWSNIHLLTYSVNQTSDGISPAPRTSRSSHSSLFDPVSHPHTLSIQPVLHTDCRWSEVTLEQRLKLLSVWTWCAQSDFRNSQAPCKKLFPFSLWVDSESRQSHVAFVMWGKRSHHCRCWKSSEKSQQPLHVLCRLFTVMVNNHTRTLFSLKPAHLAESSPTRLVLITFLQIRPKVQNLQTTSDDFRSDWSFSASEKHNQQKIKWQRQNQAQRSVLLNTKIIS